MKQLIVFAILLTVCLSSSAQRYVNKTNIDSLYNHQRLANVTILDSNEKVVTLSTIIDSIRNGHCYLMPKHLRDTSTLYLVGKRSNFNSSFITSYSNEQSAENAKKVGTKHPDFTVTDINGITLQLSKLIGKVVVLNYCFTPCSPCTHEMPYLTRLAKSYKDRSDVVFIAFARNTRAELSEFVKTTEVVYHLVPTTIKETQASNISVFPTNIVINRSGVITYFESSFDKKHVKNLTKRVAKDLAN